MRCALPGLPPPLVTKLLGELPMPKRILQTRGDMDIRSGVNALPVRRAAHCAGTGTKKKKMEGDSNAGLLTGLGLILRGTGLDLILLPCARALFGGLISPLW